MRNLPTLVTVTGFACGCGGTVSESLDGGHPFDGPSSEAAPPADASAGDVWGVPPNGGSWSPVCPEVAPREGVPCGTQYVLCEYGTAWWNTACNTFAACIQGTWTLSPLDANAQCFPAPGPNRSACPSDPNTPVVCSDAGPTCLYNQGAECACTGPTSQPATWECAPAGNCPATRPRIGAYCDISPPPRCDYYGLSFALNCLGGYWQREL
jgi:hypothetical protein